MPWRYLPVVLVLSIAAGWAWRQHRAHTRLHGEILALRPLAAEATALNAQNAAWRGRSVDTNELRRLREEKLELLRLRGEIGDLRRARGSTPEALRQRIASAENQAVEARREAELIEARMKAEDRSKETVNTLSGYAALVRQSAARGDGVVPRSWEEVRQRLELPWRPVRADRPVSPERGEQLRDHFLQWFDNASREPIQPADFEIMFVSQRFEPGFSEANRRVLLLRERTPRLRPDGGWLRAYAFLDGRVVEAESKSADFSEWEREATATATAQ